MLKANISICRGREAQDNMRIKKTSRTLLIMKLKPLGYTKNSWRGTLNLTKYIKKRELQVTIQDQSMTR